MRTQVRVSPQKFYSFKKELQEKEEGPPDSDEEIQNYSQILSELIPAYYQYRKYLQNILKETNVQPQTLTKLTYPQSEIQERVKKCKDEYSKELSIKASKSSGYMMRSYVSEKIIGKKRKAIEEERELQKKYEGKQMQYLLDNKLKPQNSTPKLEQNSTSKLQQQYPTFEQKKQVRKRKTQRSSIEQKIRELENIQNYLQENYQKNDESIEQKHEQPVSHIRAISGQLSPKTVNFELMGNSKKESDQSMKESNILQSARNNNIKLVIADSLCVDDAKMRKMAKTQRIVDQVQKNSPSLSPRNRNYESERYTSEDQDFGSTPSLSKLKRNMVQIQHNETHSEYSPKHSYIHNNPHFDLLSQKNHHHSSSTFLLSQITKLEQQKKKAQILHDEVSIVLGETGQTHAQLRQELARVNSKQNILQSNMWGTSSKLSLKQSTQDFLFTTKYLFYEICDLNSRSECYKFLLKNRQYEILKILCNQDIGKGPIFVKQLANNIISLLKNEQKSQTSVITSIIFTSQKYINFQEFGKIFNTEMNRNQYSLLKNSKDKNATYEVGLILSKLFSIWLELHYFELKLKKIAQISSVHISQITRRISDEDNKMSLEGLEKFIYSTSKNKINRLKLQLYFKKKFPIMAVDYLVSWLSQSVPIK